MRFSWLPYLDAEDLSRDRSAVGAGYSVMAGDSPN